MRRRFIIGLVLIALLLVLLTGIINTPTPIPSQTWLLNQQHEAMTLAHQQVMEADLARPDGHIYAIDITQLAIAATLANDRALYEPLRRIILHELLVDTPDEPFIDGMVGWRYKPGQPIDASGTTEALRAAEALIRGVDAFDYDDEPAVRRILNAYARHQYEENGLWYIRNYFNLGTRSFSNNSFLIDFDPDLLHELGERFDDDALRELARRSTALVRRCKTPAGLLHQMIRPEVATMMGESYMIYSVNDAEALKHVTAIAERCVVTDRPTARRVLQFVTDRLDDLHEVYNATTGKPIGEQRATEQTYLSALRLAVKLDDPQAVQDIAESLANQWQTQTRDQTDADLWLLGERLNAYLLWQQHLQASTIDE